MTAIASLFLSLTVTVALLAVTIVTGLRARRRAHLCFVTITVIGLVISIYFAARLGDEFDLAAAGWITPVHLWLARVATLAVLVTLVSGALVLAGKAPARVHRRFVQVLVGLVVLAALTGGWMLLAAEPL